MVIDEKSQADDIERGIYVCFICGHVSNSWLDSQEYMVKHIEVEKEWKLGSGLFL